MRMRSAGRSTVSSSTRTTPEPSVVPAARAPSNVSGTSRSSGPRNPPAAPPAGDPPCQVEHLAQCRAEAHLVRPRPCGVAGHAEELRAGRAVGPGPGERRSGAEHDVEHVDERLDVVDHGRLAEQADLDREGRLVARLAALPLDRLEDRGLLAADVGACPTRDLDVEGEALTHDVVAQEAAGARLCERVVQPVTGLGILAAEVHVAAL